MSLLDTLAPPRGPNKSRYGVIFFAKASFFTGVALYGLFVLVSFVLFDSDRELEVIPATRVEAEVVAPVLAFLDGRTVGAYGDAETRLHCGTEFADLEFTANYLNRGSWRVDAFYDRVRYYWRVDDVSLAVTRDPWVKTNNPTIMC
ncbi:MAG: hypothetical protein HOJ22_01330 [Chloroflexi bacterium]|nr:hypothetical protein [Chloroflexota bacterium]MBT5626910.1 hypothetical protein [Chloroflexota bacterium]